MGEVKPCKKHPESGRYKNGDCKVCKSICDKRHYAQNRERIKTTNKAWYAANKARVRRAKLMNTYGVTDQQVSEMLATQGHACAICLRAFSGDRKPNIDHCHRTSIVRGLLCTHCNHGLGKFGDDPVRLVSAALWLLAVCKKSLESD